MSVEPLASGTRVGPRSDPQRFRIKQVRQQDPHWIAYDAQDMVRGDMCVVKELAIRQGCARTGTLAVSPIEGAAALWAQAVADYLSDETAALIGGNALTVAVRGRWADAGTGYYALELLPGRQSVPFQSHAFALTDERATASGGYTPSMLSAARLPTPPPSVVQSIFQPPLEPRQDQPTSPERAAQVSTQAEMAARVAAIQSKAKESGASSAVDGAVFGLGRALAPILGSRSARIVIALLVLAALFSWLWGWMTASL